MTTAGPVSARQAGLPLAASSATTWANPVDTKMRPSAKASPPPKASLSSLSRITLVCQICLPVPASSAVTREVTSSVYIRPATTIGCAVMRVPLLDPVPTVTSQRTFSASPEARWCMAWSG